MRRIIARRDPSHTRREYANPPPRRDARLNRPLIISPSPAVATFPLSLLPISGNVYTLSVSNHNYRSFPCPDGSVRQRGQKLIQNQRQFEYKPRPQPCLVDCRRSDISSLMFITSLFEHALFVSSFPAFVSLCFLLAKNFLLILRWARGRYILHSRFHFS